MRDKIAVLLLLIALAAGSYAAFASDGTANRPWNENFQVSDAGGNGRSNCLASRFSLKLYRDGQPVGLTAAFRNFSTNGNYNFAVTPTASGYYCGFLTYSGVPVDTFYKQVRDYDVDTQYAAQDMRFRNLSGGVKGNCALIAARPTNPLLANDSRIPSSAIASSAEVAKSADWSSARAAKIDNLDAIVSSRATNSGVWSAPVRTLSNYSGVDVILTATHGTGLWSAAGTVTVVPFQGAASYETVSQGKDVHVVRGDSVAIPYTIGRDITGWTVWFGAKANPSDTVYSIPLREVTAYVTSPATGGGLINLSTADTSATARRYYAELEIRKAGEVNTPLRFYLWVDADVIR